MYLVNTALIRQLITLPNSRRPSLLFVLQHLFQRFVYGKNIDMVMVKCDRETSEPVRDKNGRYTQIKPGTIKEKPSPPMPI